MFYSRIPDLFQEVPEHTGAVMWWQPFSPFNVESNLQLYHDLTWEWSEQKLEMNWCNSERSPTAPVLQTKVWIQPPSLLEKGEEESSLTTHETLLGIIRGRGVIGIGIRWHWMKMLTGYKLRSPRSAEDGEKFQWGKFEQHRTGFGKSHFLFVKEALPWNV